MDKLDMSKECKFKYDEYWYKANELHEISQEVWLKWYSEHCGKCIYMCEVCMYGEE